MLELEALRRRQEEHMRELARIAQVGLVCVCVCVLVCVHDDKCVFVLYACTEKSRSCIRVMYEAC